MALIKKITKPTCKWKENLYLKNRYPPRNIEYNENVLLLCREELSTTQVGEMCHVCYASVAHVDCKKFFYIYIYITHIISKLRLATL